MMFAVVAGVLALGVLAGALVGWVAGTDHGYASGVRAADREWAQMLEQHVVGPTQTVNPFRERES